MQRAHGNNVISVSFSPANPSEGEEFCAIVETGMNPSHLDITIIVNGRIAFDGPIPPTKEVCLTTLPGDGGSDITAVVIQNNSNSAVAASGGHSAVITES